MISWPKNLQTTSTIKIVIIRKAFIQDKPVEIDATDTPNFIMFAPFMPAEMTRIIMDMNTSCELDPIPTGVLKQILPSVIDDITKLINACLEQAVFV